jgi:hypothetical protein
MGSEEEGVANMKCVVLIAVLEVIEPSSVAVSVALRSPVREDVEPSVLVIVAAGLKDGVVELDCENVDDGVGVAVLRREGVVLDFNEGVRERRKGDAVIEHTSEAETVCVVDRGSERLSDCENVAERSGIVLEGKTELVDV